MASRPCSDGCTCNRHKATYRGGSQPCVPGCTCARHEGKGGAPKGMFAGEANPSFKHGFAIKSGDTRNGSSRPVYYVWSSMVQRCTNSNNASYCNYGGRGISVCDRWLTFENFLEDMGEPPEGLTLDRVDNDGNYEPGNCVWATRKQQANNTRKALRRQARELQNA